MAFGDTEDLTQIGRVLSAQKVDGTSLTVDADRSYRLAHLGRGIISNFTDPIFFTFQQDFGDTGAPTADMTAEANKLALMAGHAVTLPPGITKIAYRIRQAVLGTHCMFRIVATGPWFGDR